MDGWSYCRRPDPVWEYGCPNEEFLGYDRQTLDGRDPDWQDRINIFICRDGAWGTGGNTACHISYAICPWPDCCWNPGEYKRTLFIRIILWRPFLRRAE